MALTVTFWILAIVIVLSALGVILQKNVFRAALALIVSLVAVAGIFIILSLQQISSSRLSNCGRLFRAGDLFSIKN
jgi:NADH:ubiquinone oxidoreductase subunit 6 (subunit J)